MMRILMILEHNYPPDIRVEREINSLIRGGNQVFLVCTTLTGKSEVEVDGSLTIIRKYMSKFIYKSSVGCLKFPFYLNFWRAILRQVLSLYEVDVIHVHDLPLTRLAKEIREEKGIPFVFDAHENYPYLLESSAHTKTILGKMLFSYRQWLHYEKEVLLTADVVLSVVEEQKRRFINIGADENKVFVVSNTPEPVTIDNASNNPSRTIFVYAGNIYASKGLDVMIGAFNQVCNDIPKTELWVIGNIKTWRGSSILTGKEGNKCIKCLGWQPLDEMYKLIAKADIALLPHLKNPNSDYGIPNKLFQYMMMGKPVIASNCNPIVRIIEETEAGLIYHYDNDNDLAEKMVYLYENRHLINEMGARGKEAVLNKYNWGSEEKNLFAAYDRISSLLKS